MREEDVTQTGRNPRFEKYFAKPGPWHDELIALREILLDCQLTEELKWRQPCYTREGANILILGSFKDSCALNFFKGSLLLDPQKLLTSPGPNSKAGRYMKFAGMQDIAGREKTIANYVRAAIEIEKSGEKVDFSENKTVQVSSELKNALRKDKSLRKSWDAMTPGRRRSWALHIDSAKLSKTREQRIAKAVPKILLGLGFHDEYRKRRKSE